MPNATSPIRDKANLLLALALLVAIALTGYKTVTAPITYDEAYTYLRFARQHTTDILGNYEYPNNHILHTLAVRATTRTLGDSLIAIRLPAFIGGLAFLAGIVALSRKLPEPARTGWPIAAAFLPVVMQYNSIARGYSLGAAACMWAAWLMLNALHAARRDEPRTHRTRIRLLAAGLLLGTAIGCVPTFGLFVAGILAATLLVRFAFVRPVRLRDALIDGALIVAGMLPVLIVVYGRVRMKPREWPWGFGDWQSCNRAFWEHTLNWPTAPSDALAYTLSAVVLLAACVAMVRVIRRRDASQLFLLTTFLAGLATLIAAKMILGTVWPLPRTLHWFAPFSLLAVILCITTCIASSRASRIAVALVTCIVVGASLTHWDANRHAGWEDNAAIPNAIDAIARHAEQRDKQEIEVALPWQFDVCVEYAVRAHLSQNWQLSTSDGAMAAYTILAGPDKQASGPQPIFSDPDSGIHVQYDGNAP